LIVAVITALAAINLTVTAAFHPAQRIAAIARRLVTVIASLNTGADRPVTAGR